MPWRVFLVMHSGHHNLSSIATMPLTWRNHYPFKQPPPVFLRAYASLFARNRPMLRSRGVSMRCHHFTWQLLARRRAFRIPKSRTVGSSLTFRIDYAILTATSRCIPPRFRFASSSSLFSVAVVSFRRPGAESHPHPILPLTTCAFLF